MSVSKQQGFTLVEILTSLLLSSMAVLGLFDLQIKDKTLITESFLQSRAELQMSALRELILGSGTTDPEALKPFIFKDPDLQFEFSVSVPYFSIQEYWQTKDERERHQLQLNVNR